MRKRTFAMAFLILALSLALTTVAAADGASVAGVKLNGWELLHFTETYAAPDRLTEIAKILPQTVTVTLSDGQTAEASVAGAWTPDPDNSRWTNSVSLSDLPNGTTDPNGLLDALSVAWSVESYTGSFSVSPQEQIIGQSGSFSMRRYMRGTDVVEFWRLPSDGSAAVRQITNASDGYAEAGDGLNAQYAVSAWTADDAGEWLAVYYFSSPWYAQYGAYFAGACVASPKTYTVTFRPSGGVLQGPEIRQTALVDGSYCLESVPADPVRNNYRFDGWFTQSVGGEEVSVTAQTAFTQNMTLYAHWTRLSGTGGGSGVSDGKELRTTQVAGVSATVARPDSGYAERFGWLMPANLYRTADGGFVSVDGAENKVLVTFWDADFRRTGQKEVPAELSDFGGFFHGETYNYIVFGQNNDAESDETEVFRVVKYDHDFNRVSAVSVRNCYTHIPFDAGSCRMAEYGNRLTIHTARERYLTEDGLHHQSQLTIVVNTDTMTVENNLGAFQGNHVSHSFNQFVLYDGAEHVLVDHGDAYPRGVVLHRSDGASYREVSLMDFDGATGDNWTGASVGGFEQSDDFYLVAINTVRQSAVEYASNGAHSHTLDSDERDVALLSVSKYMDAGSVRQDYLTDCYRTGTTAGVPYLVRAGDNRYVMLWQEFVKSGYSYESKGVRYAILNGNGDQLTDATLLPDAQLSKYCEPVADGDSVVWYVDTGDNARTFYRLSLTGESENPEPTESAPRIESVEASEGVVTATLVGTVPTEAQLVAALYDSDGRFVEMDMADAVSGENSVALAVGGEMKVRAFLLDGDCRPLCPAK